MREVILYLCAAAVILPGTQLLAATAGVDGRGFLPLALVRRIWRPVPPVALGLTVVFVVMGAVQIVHPAVIGALQRDPGGPWWRVVTALLVQSSGWSQLIFNFVALIAAAPVAERVFGGWWALVVYLVAGVGAHIVSTAGWSPHGGGNSVAICGLVAALAVHYLLRGPDRVLRRLLLLVPAATVVLCALTNNHGAGLAVGCVFGVLFAALRVPVTAAEEPARL